MSSLTRHCHDNLCFAKKYYLYREYLRSDRNWSDIHAEFADLWATTNIVQYNDILHVPQSRFFGRASDNYEWEYITHIIYICIIYSRLQSSR